MNKSEEKSDNGNEVVKPLTDEELWGLPVSEMPKPPTVAEKKQIDEAIGGFFDSDMGIPARLADEGVINRE